MGLSTPKIKKRIYELVGELIRTSFTTKYQLTNCNNYDNMLLWLHEKSIMLSRL